MACKVFEIFVRFLLQNPVSAESQTIDVFFKIIFKKK